MLPGPTDAGCAALWGNDLILLSISGDDDSIGDLWRAPGVYVLVNWFSI